MAGFRIVAQPRAWWPVEWDGVAEDGSIVKNRIEFRFLLLKVDAAAKFIADVTKVGELEADTDADHPALYAGLIGRVADNWRGVEAENGEALAFSPEHLRTLMNEPGLFFRTFEAFRGCINARPKLREGN